MKPLTVIEGLLIAAIAIMVAFVIAHLVVRPHRNDAELEAACRKAGGTFVHATDPLHLCVKEAKP